MDRRDDIPYIRRRAVAFVVVLVVLAAGLFLWWLGAAWLSSYITGDGGSAGVFFVCVPLFVVYVVYRVFEGMRDDGPG